MKKLRLIPGWFALLIAASITVVLFGLSKDFKGDDTLKQEEKAATASQVTLTDYFWLDTVPDSTYDPYNAYIFDGSDRYGVNLQAASSFKFAIELFDFIQIAEENKILFKFPHDRRQPSCSYEIEKMSKPVGAFTTRLVLKADPQNGGKETVYYTGPNLHIDHIVDADIPSHLKTALLEMRTGAMVHERRQAK